MPKRSNREKLVQEQLNDEETIKKRRFLLTKKDVRNDKRTTKKRSFLTLKRRLKRRKLMKTNKRTTKRRKRRQNDKNYDFLQNIVVFSSLSSTRVWLFFSSYAGKLIRGSIPTETQINYTKKMVSFLYLNLRSSLL